MFTLLSLLSCRQKTREVETMTIERKETISTLIVLGSGEWLFCLGFFACVDGSLGPPRWPHNGDVSSAVGHRSECLQTKALHDCLDGQDEREEDA